MSELYCKLFTLKRENTALWNAHWGATMIDVPNSEPDRVFSFVRHNETDEVFSAVNFSSEPVSATSAMRST